MVGASRNLSFSLASEDDLRRRRCAERVCGLGEGEGEAEVAAVLLSLPSLLVDSAVAECLEDNLRSKGLSENLLAICKASYSLRYRMAAREDRRSEVELSQSAAASLGKVPVGGRVNKPQAMGGWGCATRGASPRCQPVGGSVAHGCV